MKRVTVMLLLGAVIVAPTARADVPAGPSVYRINLVIDGAIIVATGTGSLIPYVLASHIITPTCPCDPRSVNPIDRSVIGNASNIADWVSTATVGVAIIAPPLADWLALRDVKPWFEDVVVFAETISVNSALVTVAKYTVQRPIPRVYSGAAATNDPGNYRAFYSGHTSLALAALGTASVTVTRRYGLTWQPWVATGIVGASVAMERVLSGHHFYSDVAVGAVAGTLTGVGVAHFHLRHPDAAIVAWAADTRDGGGLAVRWYR
jgi:membrane-associated phospholipid phosphatase